MTGQEKGDLLIQVTTWAGLTKLLVNFQKQPKKVMPDILKQ
jgi:hypothetical protein